MTVHVDTETATTQAVVLMTMIRLGLKCDRRTEELNGSLSVETYSNCRERGFAIIYRDYCNLGNPRQVSFSENRNSDNIVVYYGLRDDFAPNTNIPNEKVWTNAKYFGYRKYEEAQKFILDYLFNGIVG